MVTPFKTLCLAVVVNSDEVWYDSANVSNNAGSSTTPPVVVTTAPFELTTCVPSLLALTDEITSTLHVSTVSLAGIFPGLVPSPT